MKIYSQEEITKKLNRKKVRNTIIKILFYPIIIFILICNLALVFQKIREPGKNADLFGYKAFIIVSGSMEPNLKIGDIVIIKETELSSIQKKDIITFTENGELITHRISDIINKDGKIYFQTKGDNNTSVDSDLVIYENIEGKYVFKIEKIGLIVLKFQSITVVMFVVFIIYIIYKIIAEKDDRKEARHEKRKQIERKIKE